MQIFVEMRRIAQGHLPSSHAGLQVFGRLRNASEIKALKLRQQKPVKETKKADSSQQQKGQITTLKQECEPPIAALIDPVDRLIGPQDQRAAGNCRRSHKLSVQLVRCQCLVSISRFENRRLPIPVKQVDVATRIEW